ncbi:hypothetical protein BCR44DRAFT_52979 [Catenaria anguillulae PL171]|uniref:Uncharacterized protein n=1 Tax=Catenaria anguillulae PL171 TaxID=765915 RepID=A0A1Y2HLN8_9FUNG|nr:hypothetical protein BCR44DRAFT_52979 [Catenaria anguillulae PL171]
MKAFVLLGLAALLSAAINSVPALGQQMFAHDMLLENVGYKWGWCIARNNDPKKLRRGEASIHMWDCNINAEDQRTRWFYSPERATQVSLGSRADLGNLCFDVPGGNMYAGAPVRLWQCHGRQPQMFIPSITYQHIGDFPYFFLMVDSNRKLCLTAVGDHYYNGRPLVLDWCQRWANSQLWLTLNGIQPQYMLPAFPKTAPVESGKPGNNRTAHPVAGTGPMHWVPVPMDQLPLEARQRLANATLARRGSL